MADGQSPDTTRSDASGPVRRSSEPPRYALSDVDPWAQLSPVQTKIAHLLLQGAENEEIAAEIKCATRTVKAHFNRIFLRLGIDGGVKRVKLAVILYRAQVEKERAEAEANRT